MALKIFFKIAIFFNLDKDLINVKTAILYRLIDQFVYIKIFKGTKTKAKYNMVYKLWKALYGLKQSHYL